MSNNLHNTFLSHPLPGGEFTNHPHKLLRELTNLAQLRSGAARAARAVVDGLGFRGTAACIIQSVEDCNGERKTFLRCGSGVPPEQVETLATTLAAKVRQAGTFLILNNLDELFKDETWLKGGDTNTYLGVPLLDSTGAVIAVAALLGRKNHIFSEEEKSWLTIAGQLVSESLALAVLNNTCDELKQNSVDVQTRIASSNPLTPQRAVASPKPFAQQRPAPVPSPAPIAWQKAPSQSKANRPTVLVVDDDRLLNDMLCQLLAVEGYASEAAFDGQEALDVFHPAKHDLVITDLAMPRMNGWELIASLQSIAPQLPIILMSGYSIGGFDQSGASRPAVSAILTKPLAIDEFAALLNTLIPI